MLWLTLVTGSFRVSGSGDVSQSCSQTIDGSRLTHPLSVIGDVSRNCLQARDGSRLIVFVPFSIVLRMKVIAAASSIATIAPLLVAKAHMTPIW
jgi:hypothetical protein